MIQGKKILIGVTGGIAAYKAPVLVRELKKGGAEIRVVMTDSAREFVTPMTLSTISGSEVIVGTFPDQAGAVVNASTWHIHLAQWADIMVIAPATANTIAKIAHGFADNAVTSLVLALRCPLVITPAMDKDMWDNPVTKANITSLKEMGCFVLPPEEGELASGLVGPGRLPEIETIVRFVSDVLGKTHLDLSGKRILVTAGPTYEPLDPVRFIGNRSSGKMGFAIANAAALRGGDVTLVSGPSHLRTPRNVKRVDVETAAEMYEAVLQQAVSADIVVMAAAVADYTPSNVAHQKIKKETVSDLTIKVSPTRDILEKLGESKNGKILVGFALETNDEVDHARDKLRRKNLDLIVVNNPLQEGAGFGSDTNIVTLVTRNDEAEHLQLMPKFDLANKILERVMKLLRNKA